MCQIDIQSAVHSRVPVIQDGLKTHPLLPMRAESDTELVIAPYHEAGNAFAENHPVVVEGVVATKEAAFPFLDYRGARVLIQSPSVQITDRKIDRFLIFDAHRVSSLMMGTKT